MPEYQRKQLKFVHNGIDWTRALDVLPDGRYFWAHNVRSYREGEITSRPGLSPFMQIAGGYTWIHTIARMSATQNLPYVYVIGADNFVFVGQTTGQLTNGAINPVNPIGQQFSGNPLSLVEAVPTGGGTPWTYIGDTAQIRKVGYYPGDTIGVTEARFLPIGLAPPVLTTVPTAGAAGNLTGNYQWVFVQRNKFTGVQSNPSAASRFTLASPAISLTAQKGVFSAVPTTLDANHVIDVYRFGGTVFAWRQVASGLASGAAFTDNLPDSAILTALQPSQATDPVTGLTRFNLFQPFITPQPAQSGTHGTLAQQANNTWRLTRAPADPLFNLNWLPGSTITVAGVSMIIYQVIDSNTTDLANDAGSVGAGTFNWSVNSGILAAGQPARIWGPWGLGQTGAYTFGCGDGTGTLYWMNGNDSDSTDIVNSLTVTDAGEPLVLGCVFDGRNLLWSTERQFEIFPSLSTPGQFYVQEIPGSRGLWAPYSLSIQTNAQDEVSISWVSRDGPWDYSNGGGLRYLGFDLGTFLPHDNQAAVAVPLTQIGGLAISDFQPPDFTANVPQSPASPNNIRFQRLFWFMGELFWDFMQTDGNFACLVWSRYLNGGNGGWVSADNFGTLKALPVTRAIELSGMNFAAVNSAVMVAVGGLTIYAYTGTNDDGVNAISSEVIPGMQAGEDYRTQKFYGDIALDVLTAGNQLFFQVFVDFPTTGAASGVQLVAGLAPGSITNTKRLTNPVTLNSTNGVLGRSLGIYLQWLSSISVATTLYGWEVAFSPKPDVTTGRPLNKTDDGYVGAKYLRAVVIEANDLGAPREFNVLVDGVAANAAPLTFSSAGAQAELPFGFTPKVGYEFSITIDATDTSPFGWLFSQGFGIRWVWDKWPDRALIFSPWLNLGNPGIKFIQGFVLPTDTNGAAARLKVDSDDSGLQTQVPATVTTPAGRKTSTPFWFVPPFLAHNVQVQPLDPMVAFYDDLLWIWEPAPEKAGNWQTQETTHDLPGFHSLREAYIAFSDGDMTLTVTTEYGAISYPLGTSVPYTRVYLPLQPQKAKWRRYQLTSVSGARLYKKDCEVRAKAWGDSGPYRSFNPFGDASRESGARI